MTDSKTTPAPGRSSPLRAIGALMILVGVLAIIYIMFGGVSFFTVLPYGLVGLGVLVLLVGIIEERLFDIHSALTRKPD